MVLQHPEGGASFVSSVKALLANKDALALGVEQGMCPDTGMPLLPIACSSLARARFLFLFTCAVVLLLLVVGACALRVSRVVFIHMCGGLNPSHLPVDVCG